MTKFVNIMDIDGCIYTINTQAVSWITTVNDRTAICTMDGNIIYTRTKPERVMYLLQ